MTDVPEADPLYAVDPAEFVAARNALVKQLKAEKRKDDAALVAAMRRPSAAAWALNQVARSSPDLVSTALAAGGALRAATDAAVGGDASGLRDASAADRAATDAVVDRAVELLGGRGAAQRQAMAATVRAAVLDEAVRDLLQRGILTDDQEEGGFGFGFGAAVEAGADILPFVPREKKAKAPRRSDEEKEAARRAAEEAAAAEEAEREARRRKAALEAEAERLERKAARLAEVADKAELAAVEARADADEAAAAAAAARIAATDA